MISGEINKIFINTGNLTNCKELNRRATQSALEEVEETLKHTLRSWINKKGPEKSENCRSKFINSDSSMIVDKNDRINLKLTVKVFLESFSTESLNESITEVMKRLDVTVLDSVIAALPSTTASQTLMELIKPIWLLLEKFVLEGKVLTIGISDLDSNQLKDLYNWAQVKPSINQVNLESCCAMPPDLTAYAKEKDIQLLTHNDPKIAGSLIPKEMIEKILEPIVDKPKLWKANWVVRYSVFVKGRGIIQNKGYLLCAEKIMI